LISCGFIEVEITVDAYWTQHKIFPSTARAVITAQGFANTRALIDKLPHTEARAICMLQTFGLADRWRPRMTLSEASLIVDEGVEWIYVD
jgi:hypothetical protein